MKYLLILLAFVSVSAYGQSIGYMRYDTVVLQKVGGNSELKILNGTMNNIGSSLFNIGGGRTSFLNQAGDTPVLPAGFVKSGFLWYDSTGADSGLYVYHRPYWVKVGGVTDATNGLTRVAPYVVLGGTLDRYTALTLNGFPLTFRHDGVNNAAQSDSNAISLRNLTTAAGSTDSMVSPSIVHRISVKPLFAAAQIVKFRTDLVGAAGGSSGIGYYRLAASTNGGAYSTLFRISNLGVIPDKMNIMGNPIGAPSGSGGSNMSWGLNSQDSNTTGFRNVSIGVSALSKNKVSGENTAIGDHSQSENTAQYNTSVGAFSLFVNTTGEQNTAVGKNAGAANTTAQKNTFLGAGAGEQTTTGGFNLFSGHDAGLHNTTGTNNVGVGWLGWAQNITGIYNVGVGDNNGLFVTNGNRNVAIGAYSMGVTGQKDTLNDAIAIGYGAFATKSKQTVIGTDSTTETKIFGFTAGAGSKQVRYDPTTKIMYYADTSAGGSIPTFQQVLTSGSTLTTTNTVLTGSTTFGFSGSGVWYAETSGTHNNAILLDGNGIVKLSGSSNTDIRISTDSIELRSSVGKINIPVIRSGYTDTTLFKPLAIKPSGDVVQMNSWAQVSGGGGGGSTNTSIGAAYKVAVNATNNIKSLAAKYGIILDSATTGEVGIKGDSTVFIPKSVTSVIDGAKIFTNSVYNTNLTSGRLRLTGAAGIATDDDGAQYDGTTNTLQVSGPATNLTNGPKINFKFDSDANFPLSYFMYNHDNMYAPIYDAWYNGTNFVSSYASGNFAWVKNGGELIAGYNTGTSAGSTFASFNTTGGLKLANNGNVGIGVAASGIAKFNVLSTTTQQRTLYDASNYQDITVGSTGGVTYNAVGSGSAFTFSDPMTISGGLATQYTATATGITLTSTNSIVNVTATGQTITLPTAVGCAGRTYTIKLTASGSVSVATTSSQTIDGAASPYVGISAQYKYTKFVSDGANWLIIGNN